MVKRKLTKKKIERFIQTRRYRKNLFRAAAAKRSASGTGAGPTPIANNKAVVYKGVQPPKMYRTLKYSESTALNPQDGLLGKHFWSCNSIYDPNTTGAGHQPLGHDQYALFYNHYRVLSSVIKVWIQPDSTENFEPTVSGVTITDDTTVNETDYNAMVEQTNTKYRFGYGYLAANDLSAMNTPIVMKWTPKMFGKGRNSDKLEALFGVDPLEQSYWCCWLQATDLTTDLNQHWVHVEIQYRCEFSEPKELAQS